jgi:endonuclease/exonuclease/phosphatase family metal-dependent hydrolase
VAVPVRIVSYNVHSLRDDLTALASVVRALKPDVLVIQEAPRRFRWQAKCAALAHSFDMFVAVGGLPSLGNLIVTNLRVSISDTWCLKYPLTRGRHMRGAAFARCVVPGAVPFVVAGSHLSTDDTERPSQASLLLPALQAGDELAVLGIDLNESPGGPSYRTLTALGTDLGASDPQPTFPAGGPDRRIDFLFASNRLAPKAFQVYDGPLTTEASDHLPIVADLLVPPVLPA